MRHVVITGAGGGLGYECAKYFGEQGDTVYLLCRNQAKAQRAADEISARYSQAQPIPLGAELGDLEQVRAAAAALRENTARLDILINNAGVMAVPFAQSAQGVEMQFAVNHLAHFVLTREILHLFPEQSTSRIVNVSSLAHHQARAQPVWNPGRDAYGPWQAYANSKLANLLFSLGLSRELQNNGRNLRVVTCHPGYTATNIASGLGALGTLGNRLLAQSPRAGIDPIIHAATADVASASYWGPVYFELRGPVAPARQSARAQSTALAARLWKESLQLSG
ncbi:MAG: SDR family NAD(P)-dependent oxidoreductase [Pseudomonadota bacterium]